MNRQSQLYYQSQSQIIPIVDYIPVQNYSNFLQSGMWRLKENLDQSRSKEINPSIANMFQKSSVRVISRNGIMRTEGTLHQNDKKGTSIMQGISANSIPSKQISVNATQDNLKSYRTYRREKKGNQAPNLQLYTNQHSNHLMVPDLNPLKRARPRSILQEKNMHLMYQRRQLLNSIDREMGENKSRSQKSRYELKYFKKQKKQLLEKISNALKNSIDIIKDVELVKSNCEDTEVSFNEQKEKEKERASNKRAKKWVQAKNALKEAAIDSTQKCLSNSKILEQHQIIRNFASEWKNIEPQENFQSPTFLPDPIIGRKENSANNFYTGHRDFPNRKQQEIFTFNNLQDKNLQKHTKNVSIQFSQNNSKEYIAIIGQLDAIVSDCVLCRVIGKRCSFH